MVKPSSPSRRVSVGFTLVELMIAVIVVGILAAVALPSFIDQIRKTRRSDAMSVLAAIQQAQERWRSNHASYAGELANTAGSGVAPNGLGFASTTPSGYYTIALSGASPTGFTATATAVSGKSQAQDSGCQRLAVQLEGGALFYGSGSDEADMADPSRCWVK